MGCHTAQKHDHNKQQSQGRRPQDHAVASTHLRLVSNADWCPVHPSQLLKNGLPPQSYANMHMFIDEYICIYIYVHTYIYIHISTHMSRNINAAPLSRSYLTGDLSGPEQGTTGSPLEVHAATSPKIAAQF